MRRIALLGSAFDPPHYAHAAMAALAFGYGSVDEVWLSPSPDRWDKTPNAPSSLRLQWAVMMSSVLKRHGIAVSVCADELDFPSYRGSYYFLRWLERKNSLLRIGLLIGADAWASIPTWRDPLAGEINGLDLLRSFSLLVVPRPGTLIENNDQNGRISHPALPPEEQAEHRLLPTLASFNAEFNAKFGCSVKLESLSSRELRKQIKTDSVEHPFCFPSIMEHVMRSRAYLNH